MIRLIDRGLSALLLVDAADTGSLPTGRYLQRSTTAQSAQRLPTVTCTLGWARNARGLRGARYLRCVMAMELRVEQGLSRRSALEPNSLDEALRLAEMAVKSRLYNVQSAEAALMILLTGRDLGMSASQSLRGIYVVSNKPVVSADALIAAVKQSGYCESWSTVETTVERCTIETKRKGEKRSEIETWTMEDARRAGLAHKDVWKNYPRTMLRHRTAAELARRVYPDVCLGIYVQGEMRDDDQAVSRMSVPVEVVVSPASVSPATEEEFQKPSIARTIAQRLFDQIGEGKEYASTARGYAECWTENLSLLKEEFDHADIQGAKIVFVDGLVAARFKFWEEKALPLVNDESAPSLINALYRETIAAKTDADLVAVWLKHRGFVSVLEQKDHREIAYDMVVYRYGELHPEDTTAPRKAFKKLLDAQNPPPDGTNGGTPKSTNAGAQGSAAEGSTRSGAQASVTYLVPNHESAQYVASADLWQAHCLAYRSRENVLNSWAKHVAAFRASPVFSARREIAAKRYQALTNCIDENVAAAALDLAERTAENNARRQAETAATLRKAG